MFKSQRGFSLIAIIIIATAVLAGGIFAWQYWLVQKTEVKVPETPEIKDLIVKYLNSSGKILQGITINTAFDRRIPQAVIEEIIQSSIVNYSMGDTEFGKEHLMEVIEEDLNGDNYSEMIISPKKIHVLNSDWQKHLDFSGLRSRAFFIYQKKEGVWKEIGFSSGLIFKDNNKKGGYHRMIGYAPLADCVLIAQPLEWNEFLQKYWSESSWRVSFSDKPEFSNKPDCEIGR